VKEGALAVTEFFSEYSQITAADFYRGVLVAHGAGKIALCSALLAKRAASGPYAIEELIVVAASVKFKTVSEERCLEFLLKAGYALSDIYRGRAIIGALQGVGEALAQDLASSGPVSVTVLPELLDVMIRKASFTLFTTIFEKNKEALDLLSSGDVERLFEVALQEKHMVYLAPFLKRLGIQTPHPQ
jgi:hypothetical protein